MKKNIIYIILGFIFFMVSCEEDKVTYYDLGTEFLISATDYTSLDNQVTITIENQQENLTSIDATHLGGTTANKDVDGDLIPFDPPTASLGSISISAGAGTMVLTDTQLGMTEIDWNCDLLFNSVFNGLDVFRELHINVDDPISVEDPHITHRSDTTYHFKFEIEPGSATVDGVTVETKVSTAGTYAALAGPFNAEDSVAFVGTAYTIKTDTIFVRVTGTAGTKTASTVTKLTVSPYSYEEVATFVLDSSHNTAKGYDLLNMRSLTDDLAAGDSIDIQLNVTPISGGYTMGFDLINNAQFAAGTTADYTNGDVYDAENADFSTPITSNTNVAAGDVYFFRTSRGAGAYKYGIIKVVAVHKPEGVLDDSSIEFEFKYNK